MSLDGSFSCHAALRRLLSRVPNLRADPKLESLLQKAEEDVAGDDVVAALADPFLHPSYTIPIVGCFRPLSRSIADRAVAKLSDVEMRLNSEDDTTTCDEVGKDDLRVIDFYVHRGRGLRLHELTCLALCRALDLVPFLLRCVLNYFKFAPPPFRRLQLTKFGQHTGKDAIQLVDTIRVSYRILIMEPEVYTELWDWSCFLNLPTSLLDVLDIRWCGTQILSRVFKTSDRAVSNFCLAEDDAFACLLRFEEFCEDTSLEKLGCYFDGAEASQKSYFDGSVNVYSSLELNSSHLVSSDIYVLDSGSQYCSNEVSSSADDQFILTSAIKKSFEMVVMAVRQKWPVLVYGPVGSGKSAIICRCAKVFKKQVLFIHMDEQMDSKMLIGSYVCTDRPGEFRWHPGSLTQAIMSGFWVVFEDIDKSPNELQSVILPLLEGSSSFVTGLGQDVAVNESFRLFATMSSSKHEITGRPSCSTLWRRVMARPPSTADMLDIINARYPNLKPVSSRVIGRWLLISEALVLRGDKIFYPLLGPADTFERISCLTSYQLQGLQVDSAGALSRFSLRDLLKWCKRISGLRFNTSACNLSTLDCQNVIQEAVDVFVACFSSSQNRLLTIKEITRAWGMLPPDINNFYPINKPVIECEWPDLRVGRVVLQSDKKAKFVSRRPFVGIRSALHALERVACSVKHNEPVLLVGETGTGKTTLVQYLALMLGQPLTVLNLSQQSDVADLLGGYKPADSRSICLSIYKEFKELFSKSFPETVNGAYLQRCELYVIGRNWQKLLFACKKVVMSFKKAVYEQGTSTSGSKRKRPLSEKLICDWDSFSSRLDSAQNKIDNCSAVSFRFVEGAFITALRNGHWILLDEVNLAPPETLQRISGVLESEKGTLCLAERGDANYVNRHPRFRLFACMNPATDAGKRDLPYSFRCRFTEYFIDDVLDDEDLFLFVSQYLNKNDTNLANRVVSFYKSAKKESEDRLQDGANQKPQFSLRSLARAMEYAKLAEKDFDFSKALYDGICMFFLTSLDGASAKIMENIIVEHLFLGSKPPQDIPFDRYLTENLTSHTPPDSASYTEDYVLTKSVREHLKNLARAIYIKKYPVLLQGPTSSGKTSLVKYLASVTGNEFVRINNHEHTDLQEYFGTYITDPQGRLQFQEGVLVKAVRCGHWIVLDELNLAPSEVLEALNRLLDDNRELFVPELQETVHAHPNFMLFATQNPPTLYAGRKMLSRAFRNRFLEMHVDEIPDNELSTILKQRCKIPASYASKMVEVMKDLQLYRQQSKVFAGKHGFITPRDLFRWANRFRHFGTSYEHLARDGYFLFAERLRDEDEKVVVKKTLEQHLRVEIIMDKLYQPMQESCQNGNHLDAKIADVHGSFGNITWTDSMRRLFFLIQRCYYLREPVLLIGETGGGKTTVCQLLSYVLRAKLHILNCHQYTETADFVGGFYPLRDRSVLSEEFNQLIEMIKMSKLFLILSRNELSSDISHASSTIGLLNDLVNQYKQDTASYATITRRDLDVFEQLKCDLIQLHQKWQTIFLWQDGPLVQAMKDGDLFLVDEISLADDSVLERLNSILEPERKLTLSEKGGSILETITAHPNFFLLATMNPGGDYGKKELSPALRNRFTEIWVPAVTDIIELQSIAVARFIRPEFSYLGKCMVKFWEWFNKLQTGRILTVRDLLSWISFVNATEGSLGPQYALLHGVFLILLDGLSLGTSLSKYDVKVLRERSTFFLLGELKEAGAAVVDSHMSNLETYGWGDEVKHTESHRATEVDSEERFGISPFYICKGGRSCKRVGFEFLAPTTSRNVLRVLRAAQLLKPVLLEGSPGVGKTSLIVALAEYSGHDVVRINLSEQTDMMDLLGSDLPVQGENGMEFSWSDGILLQALKNGSWVLLDELNLAPQSVLEGLNAILDHRAEVFIPELGLTFKCPSSFRVFACQNPTHQGGGRKGLPKSFLNRFTKVYVDELDARDYFFICQSRYPSISPQILRNLVAFNSRLFEDTMIFRKYGQEGSPWEFNLRDVMRSCQIIQDASDGSVDDFLNIVYLQRMRTIVDRQKVLNLYEEIFQRKPSINQFPKLHVNPNYLIIGSACVKRNHFQPAKTIASQLRILPGILHTLEAVLHCVQKEWLCILVGPYSSGKTSVIRLLAHLTGNVLHELNLSVGTDVTDLLGCFEQYNSFRIFRSVISQVERYVEEYFSLQLEEDWKDLLSNRREVFSNWLVFLSSKNYDFLTSCTFPEVDKLEALISVDAVIEIVGKLKHDMEIYKLPLSWTNIDLDRLLKSLSYIKKHRLIQPSANFQWVAGDLINAIENGEWVVLDNANLCNPTVLDRINSLVEPNGSITVNECGLVDGRPMILHAHANFRMFLTIDPKHGEVSRAMRNRGLEVFMLHQSRLPDTECYDDSERNDVKRFLISAGIRNLNLVTTMTEAHLYAKEAGLSLGTRITLLELTRWVQLFQQLLFGGNKLKWSLELSWEHTYLSSLGEVEGRGTILQGKLSCLSKLDLDNVDHISGCSLSSPGWPVPHALRYLSWYSREETVKQNCAYLELLGSRCISYILSIDCHGIFPLHENGKFKPSFLPSHMLQHLLFPGSGFIEDTKDDSKSKHFDLDLARKMFLFAANWTIEQATDRDLALYICWFKWYNSYLQPFKKYNSHVRPYCHFLDLFVNIVEQERDHPIWKCIFDSWREMNLYHHIDTDTLPLPLLSLEVVKLDGLRDMPESGKQRFHNAVNSVSMLRLSYQQWALDIDYSYSEDTLHILPMLNSLRQLESEVLKVVIESQELVQTYGRILEYHILFWKTISSSNLEELPITWSLLRKELLKLQPLLPTVIAASLVETLNLHRTLISKFDMEKPTLWLYGGHPLLPSSADVYYQMQEILKLCDSIWPQKSLVKRNFDVIPDKEAVISSLLDLRLLGVQGICLSLYLSAKNDDDGDIKPKMEQLFQDLSRRFESERRNIEPLFSSTTNAFSSIGRGSTNCCSFCLDDLSRQSGFKSWLVTMPLFDITTFNLDIKMLTALSKITLLDAADVHGELLKTSYLLQYALHYSLNFSSRPIDYTSHQIILWYLDDWSKVDYVHSKIATCVLDMWFKYHSSMWSFFCEPLGATSQSSSSESCHLEHPTRIKAIDNILQSCSSIKDHEMECLKLRVASRSLWQATSLQDDFISLLYSAANSLFTQIILVHRKSFSEGAFFRIKTILSGVSQTGATGKELKTLIALISTSRHTVLASLVDSLIEPLLNELYVKGPTYDSLQNLGLAWLHIGMLRFYLIRNRDGPDPVLKYSVKHSHVMHRISLLGLEIKVRQDCELEVGNGFTDCFEDGRSQTLKTLKASEKKARGKVVFRPPISKHKSLKGLFVNLSETLSSCLVVVEKLKSSGHVDIQLMVDVMCNWQVTSSSIIQKLSDEFVEYTDLIQPVQVAIYEMKLGLLLVLSDALEKVYLEKVGESIENVTATVHALMSFPRWRLGSISGNVNLSESLQSGQIQLLKKLAQISCEKDPEPVVSFVLLESTILYLVLICTADQIFCSGQINKSFFLLLKDIFKHFTRIWVDMKSRLKDKANDESQYYKFRHRVVKIEDFVGTDISPLGTLGSDRGFISDEIEQEFNEMMKPREEDQIINDGWDLIPDFMLTSIVRVHNQLFGPIKLVKQSEPDHYGVAKEERIISFMESYSLGSKMMKDLQGIRSSILDDNLIVENLFYVCLKSQDMCQPTGAYNVYKDPNSLALHKMVKPLTITRERVAHFLNESPDGFEHPGLTKLLEVADMILSYPSSTPLAKALLGLQMLIGRAESLQESSPKFSLKDQLNQIYTVISSWQKIELESWPTLLDLVQEEYENSAGKLLFPLHAVLHHRLDHDTENGDISTVKSIEEFLQTSSIGEFKNRLYLLLSFHGQINQGITSNAYCSTFAEENLNVLYNAFGYYSQFLPLVMEHIASGRKSIENDLKQHVKLFSWEQCHNYSSIETFRRMRKKIWKLVHGFNDVLQQPLMVVLRQEAAKKIEKLPDWLESCACDKMSIDVMKFPINLMELTNAERFLWYGEWRNKANSTFDFMENGESVELIKKSWEESWSALERICRNASELAHIWKHESKNLIKRRSFINFLRILEDSGLSRHRPMIAQLESESGQSNCFYLQPSYDIVHLLQKESWHDPSKDSKLVGFTRSHYENSGDDKFSLQWKSANQFYFQNLAVMKQLREICLNFHNDFTLEQVNRATSFLDHLIVMQQEQRISGYAALAKLRKLRQQFCMLGIRADQNSKVAANQGALLKCMWEQKALFDSLVAMSRDVNLLLGCLKSSHLHDCKEIMADANIISTFIDEFIPMFVKSKESLDSYLLASEGLSKSCAHVPLIVSQEMEQLVVSNLKEITAFQIAINERQKPSMRSVETTLFKHFEELIVKKKQIIEDILIQHAGKNDQSVASIDNFMVLQDLYIDAYGRVRELVNGVYAKLCMAGKDHAFGQEFSSVNITRWKDMFEFLVMDLRLEEIYDAVNRIIIAASNLIECAIINSKAEVCSQIELEIKHLLLFLDVIVTFGEGILSEFISAHKSIAELTNAVANIFVLLFSKGFNSAQDTSESLVGNGTNEATGTGMGEGEGVNDVSEQIEDESQLLGTSQQNELDKSDKVPEGKDKGIEMEEDFDAGTFSVSEDSGDSGSDDEEDPKLESQMGQTANSKQAIGEKLWDKDEDDNPESSNEKYETGPSVEDKDPACRELRAKDDTEHSELAEMENNEHDRLSIDENEETENVDNDAETDADVSVEKSQAFEDPTGSDFQEKEQETEDVNMDESQNSDVTDGSSSDKEMKDVDDIPIQDEVMEDDSSVEVDEGTQNKDGRDESEISNMDIETRERYESDKSQLFELSQDPKNVGHYNDSIDTMDTVMQWASSTDFNASIAPSMASPSAEVTNTDIPNSLDGTKVSNDNPQSRLENSQGGNSSIQMANPYRSEGDAMKEFKERAKVSAEPQENQSEVPDNITDENAEDYRYVSEFEKSTSQTLGAATSEQLKNDFGGNQLTRDESEIRKNEAQDEMNMMDNSEMCHLEQKKPFDLKQKVEKEYMDVAAVDGDSTEDGWQDSSTNMSGDMVSFQSSCMDEVLLPADISKDGKDVLSLGCNHTSDERCLETIRDWKRYEMATTRLSQELTEHLRLVMEPTLASKLQGDYKTGKRINMKKVIPYIASHFRKDKIWLRRTKPNKRNYQVVIAIDDSLSMSENCCENAAVEALVIVCRAMSQLEVGQFAITSFGKTGNINVLHDFDQPFTGETGSKIISSLSFKQDNNPGDDPMVELLTYLNNMLDSAVAKARMPSGQNPLNQLVLIISDGRFREKENIRRRVRNLLSRKRLVAFIILDRPDSTEGGSIMDLQDTSFKNGGCSFTSYMSTFPFPYYVVLRSSEALPRTLADMLRQWFELMQTATE